MGVPVAVFPPVAPADPVEPVDPVEPLEAPALLGAAVVAVEDFDDDPQADSRATPSKALPAMAAAPRPRLFNFRRRRVGAVPAPPSVPSCCSVMVKGFSPGKCRPGYSGRLTVAAYDKRVTSPTMKNDSS